MAEHECSPGQGYSGIVAALGRAVPGDTVRLGPGTYEGSETLRLGNGVTLTGEGARLVHDGTGPAIEASEAADVAVEGLDVEVVATEVPLRRRPNDAPFEDLDEARVDLGVLWFDEVVRGCVRNVSITGARSAHGISLLGGQGTRVSGCTIEGGERSGIVLLRTRAGSIDRNRCHGNTEAGIVLFSAESEAVEDNECWENDTGIALQLDRENTELPARARLTGNRCHGNTKAGILLFSAESEAVEDNDCWDNDTGIALQLDPKNTELPARARLTGNRCHGNTEAGILLFSAESEAVEDNDCWDNDTGIALQLDRENTELPARARLTGNRCHGNTKAGILLFSAESEAVEDNDCWDNDTGIALQLDPKNTELPARARLTGNRCHGNTKAGILLFSAESEAVEGNECWENGASGIALQLDRENTELPARVRLTGNRCHGNTQSGIVLASAESEAVEGNECWENGMSGIALQLDPKNTELPARARLTGNRCHGNTEAGILLFSAESEAVEGNECWENGMSGIALSSIPRTPNCPPGRG